MIMVCGGAAPRLGASADSTAAEVEELPGCFASGTDIDELVEAAAEAIAMYLDDTSGGSDDEAKIVPLSGHRRAQGPAHYAVDRAEILLEA